MMHKKIDRQPENGCLSFIKNNLYLCFGVILIVALCMYGIFGIFGFSAYPDEFGYWSPAAMILGYDWSSITELGSYYSYGYSLLLVPVLGLFDGAINTYRAAVVLNLLMQCLSVPMLYAIISKLYPFGRRSEKAIVVSVSVLYPAWVFYTQTTMSESLLNFLFVLSVFLMMRFLDKPVISRGILFVLVLVYSYFVHMRCIGTIGAGMLVMIIFVFTKRKTKFGKKALLLPLIIIGLFGASFIIKSFVIDSLYKGTSSDMLSWNDYTSIPYRVMKILNIDGFIYLIKDIVGKLFYIGMATYGIGYFGIYALIKQSINSIKNIKARRSGPKDMLWLYIALLVLAQFMVALIYLNGASNPENDRLDIFLHGRYIDFFLPVIIGIGVCEMLNTRKYVHFVVVTLAFYILGFYICRGAILDNLVSMSNAHGFTMIGMSHFLVKNPQPDTLSYLFKQTILGTVLTLIAFAAVALYRKVRIETFLLIVLIMQVLFSIDACKHYIFPNQSYIYGDIMIGEKLSEIRKSYPDKKIVNIYEGGVAYIELVQFEDKEAPIEVVKCEDEKLDTEQVFTDDIILIMNFNSEYAEAADTYYDEKWAIGHLALYYNP